MARHPSTSSVPAVSAAFLVAAVAFLCVGVGLGLFMAASEDHSLSPVHAHTNLLGWVSSALMGLFHARFETLRRRVVWTQFVAYVVGVICMMVGLVGVLRSFPYLLPFLAAGTALTLVGIGLFAWAVINLAREGWAKPAPQEEVRMWESG